MTEPGTMVHKGDLIARIDSRSLADRVDDLESNYVSSLASVKKLKAELLIDAHNLEHEIRLAKAELDQWKIEAAAAEIRTVVDRELLEIGVEESEAVYMQKLDDRQLNDVSQQAEVRAEEISSERSKLNLDRNQRDLDRCDIASPIDGMVVRESIIRDSEQSTVKIGDQLRPGQPFLKVIDTSHMEINAQVSQAVGNLLRLGQTARVGLDAYPEVELTGTVTSIGAMARSEMSSDYVRWIPIRISINGADPKLLPDLSAWADITVESAENVIEVPRSALAEESGQYYVSVLSGGKFERRPVTVSLLTYISAAVTSGIEPGQKIATYYQAQ
jgi:RND family efflux transporter MFP subunit